MFWQKHFQQFVTHMHQHQVPLRIRLWNGTEVRLGDNPTVAITVPDISGLKHLLNPTLDSLGHAYVEGKIRVEGSLHDIIDIATRLAAHAGDKALVRRRPLITKHSREIDAEAIAYHYDVSNDFYRLWLDEHMIYSCGYFRSADDSLEQAQLQKIDHILTKLKVRPGDTLLDVGCGWGSLIMRAAEKFGARATGITLSRNQFELAQERIARAGLQDSCEVRIEDYRDVAGRYDRISSVGMFEHVGLDYLPGYFQALRERLNPNGAVLNHGITSTDPESRRGPLGGGEFIGRYVFPHGELPHISLALRELCTAGLEPVDVENLRRHYTITLQHWAERFEKHSDTILNMVGEKRWRIWRIYLAGCAYGFDQSWVALHQILATRAGNNHWSMTRDYMYR